MAQKTKRTLDENGDIVLEQEPNMVDALKAITVEKKEVKKEPKTYVFRLITNASPSEKRQFPPRFMLANTDIIFDEEAGYKRAIRYLPGINTLWVDEQENLPDNIVNRRPSINFVDGYLYVQSTDRMLVEFLTKSNRCANAENRDGNIPPTYEMMNFEAISKKNIQNVKTKHEAMKIALSASEESMMEHIDYLGVTRINVQGIEKDSDELRVEYVSVAENRPDIFLKSYNNPTTKAFHLVKQALDSGKLTEIITPGQVHWSDTRALVAVIPSERKHLTTWLSFASRKERARGSMNALRVVNNKYICTK